MRPGSRLDEVQVAAAVLSARLEERGSVRLDFVGSSMTPTILPGARLEVAPLSILEPGRVYVFLARNPDGSAALVAHRLARFVGEDLVFRGDGRSLDDLPVAMSALLGEVVDWWIE